MPRARSLDSNSSESAPQVFLRAFVRALILNTAVYQEAVRKQQKARVLAQNRIPLLQIESSQATEPATAEGYTSINTTYSPQTTQIQKNPQLLPSLKPNTTQFIPLKQPLLPLTPPVSRPLPLRPAAYQSSMPPRPTVPQNAQAITFTNQIIQQWLNDPRVQSVECPGPGKPLVIVKQNRPQVTSQSLDREAILAFLQEVAQKTKIPIGEGLYKAIIGPYIITAVLSEMIGNRYIIQRR